MNPNEVYHASNVKGLTELSPRESTHQKPWVYATSDMALAALFLSNIGGDLSCAIGYHNDELCIYERWQGAFDCRYDGHGGSIYVLPGQTFRQGLTSFNAEVVSEVAVPVIREIEVPDAKQYLLELERSGRLKILRFADRPPWIPEDDRDLVEKAVTWVGTFGQGVMDYVEKYLPHLVPRVRKGLSGDSDAGS